MLKILAFFFSINFILNKKAFLSSLYIFLKYPDKKNLVTLLSNKLYNVFISNIV